MRTISSETNTEIIDGKLYYLFDTVFVVPLNIRNQKVFKGLLYGVGNSSYIELIMNGIIYEFRFESVHETRMVLIEKDWSIYDKQYE